MKRIKDIRENYDLITEKEEADTKKLATLVRSGLFDAKKLPFIKRALEKNPADMTVAERKILIELLEQLMSQVLHSQQVYNKVKSNLTRSELNEEVELDEAVSKNYLVKMDPRFSKSMSEKDIPSIIILKRKAVRVYPDNQKVGLYYSQALDKYVSIPFETGALAHLNAGLNEAKGDEDKKKNKKLEIAQRLRKLNLKDMPDTQAGKKASRAVTGQAFKDALTVTRSQDAATRLGSLGFGLASLIPGRKKVTKTAKKDASPQTTATQPKVAEKPVTTSSAAPERVIPTKKFRKRKNPVAGTGEQPTGDFKFAEPSNKTKTASYSSQLTRARELSPLEKSSGKSVEAKQLPRKRYSGIDKPLPGTGSQPSIANKPKKLRTALMRKLEEKRNLQELKKPSARKPKDEPEVVAAKTKSNNKSSTAAEIADIATDLIPGVSNVKSAVSAYSNIKKGNYGAAALDAALAIPGVGNIGKAAKSAYKASKLAGKLANKSKKVLDVPKVKPTEVKPTEVKPVKPTEVKPSKTVDKEPVSTPKKSSETKTDTKTQSKSDSKPDAKTKGADKKPSWLRRQARRGLDLDIGGGGAGSSPEEPKKFVKPGQFGLKATVSGPTSFSTKASLEKRDEAKYRKDLQTEEVSDKPKYINVGNFKRQANTVGVKTFSTDTATKSRDERLYRKSLQENNVIETLKGMSLNNLSEHTLNIGNDSIIINNIIAEKIVSVYENLNEDNKNKFNNMMNDSVESFKKIVNFSVRQ